MIIAKAPFNYIGNKYRILGKIKEFFPRNINTMVDLFCGGCDVIINTHASFRYANDINFFVIDICREFQSRNIDNILYHIDRAISVWGLTKDDKEAYIRFRTYCNKTKNPLDLYTLICFSFNYQFRFNNSHEYNNPFGKNRSSFNSVIRNNLIEFKRRIDDVVFSSEDFINFDYSILAEGDFLYADPPYLISCGSYNDGRRGFRGWSRYDDYNLLTILQKLSERGVLFALSNVLEHKGRKNEFLIDWIKRNGYSIHDIEFNYDNCNYHSHNRQNKTREVLITNYQ